jgi:lipoprotein NlpD
VNVSVKGLLLLPVLCLALLTACHSHRRPAPVEEQSGSQSTSRKNADGSYSVRSGDTLSVIAFSYGLDHRDLAAWNGISSPYVIFPGQRLRLSAPAPVNHPNSGRSSGVQTSGIKSPSASTTRTQASSTPLGATTNSATTKPATTKAAPPEQAATPAPQTASVKTTAEQSAADPQSWRWPANGRVLRGYVATNPSRNGLDIVGTEGQPVMASAAGKVVYSGNGLLGYGELIIIKHSDRMLSAYAHNKLRLVKEGEQVSAGQKIAKMGRNDQNEQLLHFEIRVRGKPVDPIEYLPKK